MYSFFVRSISMFIFFIIKILIALTILMLLPHSQYLVFFFDLAIRDSTPFARSIFDVYILLFDPCLNVRNLSLRLNEKKFYTLPTLHICTIRTCRDAFNRSVDVFGYYTYVHIRCTTLLPPFFSEIRGFIVKN